MKQHLNIHFGNQNEHLVPGVFTFIGAVAFMFVYPLIGVLLLAVSISMFSIHRGIEFDVENRAVRKYRQLFKQRFGPWFSVSKIKSCRLDYFRETGLNRMQYQNRKLEYRTFDLIFVLESGEELEFNDFIDYQMALKTCKILEEEFGLEIKNEFEEKMNSRRGRRRR
jgi:hypothetical protein